MCLPASETKSAYFGIGRRKTSVAKVILVPGTGSMVVNHKQGDAYLQYKVSDKNTVGLRASSKIFAYQPNLTRTRVGLPVQRLQHGIEFFWQM